MPFRDRVEAGRRLAEQLAGWRGSNALVLALPGGSVQVAAVVAWELELPLSVLAVQTIPYSGNPDLAIGAVAEGGEPEFDSEGVESLSVSHAYRVAETERAREKVERQVAHWRDGQPLPPLRGRAVLLVGEAVTGSLLMRASAKALRAAGVAVLTLATPVLAESVAADIQRVVDHVITLERPRGVVEAGTWYQQYPHVSDREVQELLTQARHQHIPM